MQPAENPGVEAGDSIYFKHPQRGAHCGNVVCHGKHGATVKDDAGQVHKVRWGDVVGHKARKAKTARVVDAGDVVLVKGSNSVGLGRLVSHLT